MSIPVITPSHVFGINPTVRTPLHHLDDQTVLYPSGTQLVLYNTETKTQRFVAINEGEGVSAIAVKDGFVGVGVKGHGGGPENVTVARRGSAMKSVLGTVPGTAMGSGTGERIGAMVVVVDLGNPKAKRKLLGTGDMIVKEFISVSFAADGKHILAQSSGPDWSLYLWSIEKTKLVTFLKFTTPNNAEINQMSVNPYDAATTQVCMTGNGVFRLYKYAEGSFKLGTQQKPEKNLLCHTWLTDTRLMVGTSDSKLLLYDSGDLILEISYLLPTTLAFATPPSITTLTPFSAGLLAGTSNGICVLFEKTDDAYIYKKSKEFVVDGEVRGVAMSPAEDAAVVATAECQVYGVALDADSSKGEEIKCDRLTQPFHRGAILGMDTCARKPLIATCGADKSVRIWNYVDNCLEVMKIFDDEPMSIALHPSGLYVLVGFAGALKLMNVLIDDIRPYWETNVRGCRECRFSHGGQYFAAVHGSTITLYTTWSFDPLGTLKGHQGKVRSISWSPDDTRLVTCGIDGAVYDWNVRTLKREGEVVQKGNVFGGAAYTGDMKLVYAVGSDGNIKEIENGHIFREIPVKAQVATILLSRSSKMFFAVTARPSIRALRFPFPQDNPASDHTELACHSGAITRIRMSYDDQYLFTCGEDGCLWVYKVMEKEARGGKGREKDVTYSDEILVTKSDLKDNFKTMAELKQRVEELKSENETQVRMRELTYADKIREMTEKYQNEIEALKQLTSSLKSERENNRVWHMEQLNETIHSNKNEIKEVEAVFNQKMQEESEKYIVLQKRMAEMKAQWETQMQDAETSHANKVKEITEYYRKKIQERVDAVVQTKESFQSQHLSHYSNLREIDADADTEILSLSHAFELKLKEERDSLSSIKEENASMKSKFDSLTREIEEQKAELAKMASEERRLQGIIKGLERDIVGVKREMQERDDTIQDKEKRIYDLKKKNQELEKFKFVLDYKIMELKKQVEPRERDIITLSHQIQDMDEELHDYHKRHDSLDNDIQDLVMKLRGVHGEGRVQAWREKEVRATLNRIRNDLDILWEKADNLAELKVLALVPTRILLLCFKRNLVKLHHKYSNTIETPGRPPGLMGTPASPISSLLRPSSQDSAAAAAAEEGPTEEDAQQFAQREHLEHTVATLEHKLAKEDESRHTENLRIMQENVMLVSEINTLRKDLKAAESRTSRLINLAARGGPLTPDDEDLLRPISTRESIKRLRTGAGKEWRDD
ncbi:Cilia- and flagella-associated protein 57 [Borealophlyctis nickersoniae]|nr:Cilia- and flagella-associated protein 57 [Borealophlyctis nickersoniae]